MQLELSKLEAEHLEKLLNGDLEEARVEVHHAKNIEYKAHLQGREKLVQALIDRLKASS